MHQLSCERFPAELRGADCKTYTIESASGPGPLRRQLSTLVARTSWLPGSLGYWSGSTAALVERGASVVFTDTVEDAARQIAPATGAGASVRGPERQRVPAERRSPLPTEHAESSHRFPSPLGLPAGQARSWPPVGGRGHQERPQVQMLGQSGSLTEVMKTGRNGLRVTPGGLLGRPEAMNLE